LKNIHTKHALGPFTRPSSTLPGVERRFFTLVEKEEMP